PDQRYKIEFRVAFSILPDSVGTLMLSVNGKPLELTSKRDDNGGTIFSGVIPQSVVALDASNTALSFRIPAITSPKAVGMNDDARPLGLLFDWLDIQPESPG